MKESNYTTAIIETSRQLKAIERVRIKDISNSLKLNSVIDTESLTIDFDYYVKLQVHNESADNTDYEVYVVADKNGTTYYTSSPSFMQSLYDVLEEMEGETGWGLEVYKVKSKNQANNPFIKCTVCEI